MFFKGNVINFVKMYVFDEILIVLTIQDHWNVKIALKRARADPGNPRGFSQRSSVICFKTVSK